MRPPRLSVTEHTIPGGTAFVPGAAPHTFANAAGEPCRFMVAMSPGGFEEYFRAMAAGEEAAALAVAARLGYAPFPSPRGGLDE